MSPYRTFIAALGALLALYSTPAVAVEQAARPKACVEYFPSKYQLLLVGYAAWTPSSKDAEFAQSVYNWGNHAYIDGTDGDAKTYLAGLRNWAFLRTEASFRELIGACTPELRKFFGGYFLEHGLHAVFSKPYADDVITRYRAWYTCYGGANQDSKENVIGAVAHSLDSDGSKSPDIDTCRKEFDELSKYYGVEKLTVDDIVTIGFLDRRQKASMGNKNFVAVEVIRSAVHDVFASE